MVPPSRSTAASSWTGAPLGHLMASPTRHCSTRAASRDSSEPTSRSRMAGPAAPVANSLSATGPPAEERTGIGAGLLWGLESYTERIESLNGGMVPGPPILRARLRLGVRG